MACPGARSEEARLQLMGTETLCCSLLGPENDQDRWHHLDAVHRVDPVLHLDQGQLWKLLELLFHRQGVHPIVLLLLLHQLVLVLVLKCLVKIFVDPLPGGHCVALVLQLVLRGDHLQEPNHQQMQEIQKNHQHKLKK